MSAVARQADPRPGVAGRASPPTWVALTESLILGGLALAIGAAIDRSDPFLLGRGFSWLALAPLLAGLRYGSGMGLLSGASLVVALALSSKGASPSQIPIEPAVGWIAMGLLGGEFADAWRRRNGDLAACAEDLRAELERLGRSYHALEASHEDLRRQIPNHSTTLRDALEELERSLGDRAHPGALEEAGGRILALLGEFASVQSAGLHGLDASGRPGAAIATVGAGSCRADDPLLVAAAESGRVTSVRQRGDGSQLLSAVPLVDARGRVHAVVAIRDMPFLSLNEGTLTQLAVLGGCLGDLIAPPAPRARADAPRQPARPQPVELELPSVPGMEEELTAPLSVSSSAASAQRTEGDPS